MHKKLLSVLSLILYSYLAFAGWENMNSGINDNLTGVVFFGQNGMVSGHKGLYFTTSGGIGPASWTRLEVANEATATIYNNTRFNDATSTTSSAFQNKVYACGRDTVNNRAIVVRVDLLTLQLDIMYQGVTGSSLNRIRYNTYSNAFFAVGINGLMVSISSNTTTLISTGLTLDLNSISFSPSYFLIAAGEVIVKGSLNQNESTYNTLIAGQNTLDVLYLNINTYCGVGATFIMYSISVTYPPLNFGPLNANVIIDTGTGFLVGTNHGIYCSVNAYSYLEYQPSSLNYNIKSFWKGTTTYACGANGVILQATDNGGPTIPLAIMNVVGGCDGEYTLFYPQTGTSTSCEWLDNGTTFQTTCTNYFYYLFPPGQHNLELRVTNPGGLSDTSFQSFTVVPAPKINMATALSDSLLCKAESIEIRLDSSQHNVVYSLRKFGSNESFGYSTAGNGDSLILQTSIIDVAGNYYLRSESTIGVCYKNFTDTIKIDIEETKANFHSSKINLVIGEETVFFQNCSDAQNYYWDLPLNSEISNATTPDIITSFSSDEETEIKLICWSNNGCYDTVSKAIPNIYVEPDGSDSCWALVNKGKDINLSGYYSDIGQISETSNGFIYSGSFQDIILASYAGDSAKIPGEDGSYAAFSNFNGVLKWLVYTNQIHNTGPGGSDIMDIISAVQEDREGNFYLAGRTLDKFYDNSGDSTVVGDGSNYGGFLIKLDSIGQLIWKISGDFYPLELKTDYLNNVFIVTQGMENLVFNDTVEYLMNDYFMIEGNYSIVKFDALGSILWGTALPISYVNSGAPVKIDVDINNNLYITGTYEQYVKFYSAFDTFPITLSSNVYGTKLFLAKYDSGGTFKWAVKGSSTNVSSDNTAPADMFTDSIGNCFITGQNNAWGINSNFIVRNSDGSTVIHSGGNYFVMKIDSSGYCQWINSADESYYGTGFIITKEGPEISVLGQVEGFDQQQADVTFTSSNNHAIHLIPDYGIYFLTVYDTAGNLLRITKSSDTLQFYNNFGFGGFFKKDGAYYLSQSLIVNYPTELFGSSIPNNHEEDGLLLKFTESCGIVVPMCNTYLDLSINTCEKYMAPWGTLLTHTGIYRDTIPNSSGCDSVTTVNFTFGIPPVIINQVSCETFTLNGIVYSHSGNYIQSLQSVTGCDSIIFLNLIIGTGPVFTEINYISCSGFYVFNDSVLTVPGTYQRILQTYTGCDSLIILHLEFELPSSSTLDTNSCNTVNINGINYSETGIYQQIFVNTVGCDSTLNLQVTISPLNSAISVQDNFFSASDSTASYQWLNCETGEIIIGENNWQFVATSAGSYAAIITKDNCSDTSACIVTLRVNEIIDRNDKITIYPNPSSEFIIVNTLQRHSKLSAELSDVSGKLIAKKSVENAKQFELDIRSLYSGVYLLSITREDGKRTVHKIIKE